jgi:hypothetical protein
MFQTERDFDWNFFSTPKMCFAILLEYVVIFTYSFEPLLNSLEFLLFN